MNTVRVGRFLLLLGVAAVTGCGHEVDPEVMLIESREAPPDGTPTTSVDAVPPTGAGVLRGRIVLDGAVPMLPPLVVQGAEIRHAEVCSAQDVPDESLVVGADRGVANVFIYLVKPPSGVAVPPASPEPVIFDQRQCRFLPHALLVRTGQTVKVLSDDPIVHNTRTYPLRNTGVSEITAASDRVGRKTLHYRRAELIPVRVMCDYHPYMLAWHLPLDHPWAAVSGPNGEFEIRDVPAGQHEFRVWHEAVEGGVIARRLPVSIRDGETSELLIDLPLASLRL